MCTFFSFITKGDGKLLYINAYDRLYDRAPYGDSDSHSALASYFKLNCDRVNKYEYVNGKFIIDQINTIDDSDAVAKSIKAFVESSEFQDICIAAVTQNGDALQYVKKQTPELCMAAVTQNSYALRYVKEQTPELCMAAKKQLNN